jgi:RNA polymerase sigma-70 factor (ECF subfamily)
MNRKEERKLVRRALKGDNDAWTTLYSQFRPKLIPLIARFVGYEHADDMLQTVFLQLFRKLKQFRGDSALGTWIYRLTVNECLQSLRKPRVSTVSIEEMWDSRGEHATAEDYNPALGQEDNRITSAADRIQVWKAIETLPMGYRKHIVLKDLDGYEHKEVAEILGCTVGNSKSQLHRARHKLRIQLKPRIGAGKKCST